MENEQADAGRDCRTRPSRETKFSGANRDREIFVFRAGLATFYPVDPYTLLYVMTNHTQSSLTQTHKIIMII